MQAYEREARRLYRGYWFVTNGLMMIARHAQREATDNQRADEAPGNFSSDDGWRDADDDVARSERSTNDRRVPAASFRTAAARLSRVESQLSCDPIAVAPNRTKPMISKPRLSLQLLFLLVLLISSCASSQKMPAPGRHAGHRCQFGSSGQRDSRELLLFLPFHGRERALVRCYIADVSGRQLGA